MKIKIILRDIDETVMWVYSNLLIPHTIRHEKKWFRKHKLFIGDDNEAPLVYDAEWKCKEDQTMLCYLRAVLDRKLKLPITYVNSNVVTTTRKATIRELLMCDTYRSIPNKSTLSVEIFNEKDKRRIIKMNGKNKDIVSKRKTVKKLLKQKHILISRKQDVREFFLSLTGLIDVNYKKFDYSKLR